MTNEIVSLTSIPFGQHTIRLLVFEDGNVMMVVDAPGLTVDIHGEHKGLVKLRNALSEVLANGT